MVQQLDPLAEPEQTAGNPKPGDTLKCLLRILILAIVIFSGAVVSVWLLPDPSIVYSEGAILEMLSVGVWGASGLLGAWTALRAGRTTEAALAFWLAVIATMALLRELDAQILLNPKTLGNLGVRYKVSWWLDGSVPIWLKLGWGLFFLVIAALVFWPVYRAREDIWRMIRGLDMRVVLLGAAGVFLALGFVIDDLLRGSKLISMNTRKLFEETSEFIGALVFLCLAYRHNRETRKHRANPP